ncbi:MAG: tetratricopeptide (TPR) repeat protein [Saprospiraceae bacterium]|jgi:tetratricopeptide (TPR) repeat protein|tara:strand:+ start:923 stop:1243 length:321 start_codon:yes stop_codon:yes gene_type:complete
MQKNRIDTLIKFLEDDPGDSFIKFAIAKEYEKMGTLKKALDTYLELRKMDPKYVGLYYHLAALQIELSMPDEALKTYDEGIEIAKKAADFHALSELHTAKLNIDIE